MSLGCRLAIAALWALVALVAGCAGPPGTGRSAAAPPTTAPPALTTMPDFHGTPVQEAGELLAASGIEVIVVVPEHVVTADEEFRRSREHTNPARPRTIPERRARFDGTETWAQAVAGQEPEPDSALSPGDTVTLVAGRHAGGDVSRPWVWEHAPEVIRTGGGSCFECHKENECVGCHIPMLEAPGPP